MFGREFRCRSARRSWRAPPRHTPSRCPSSSLEKACRWSLRQHVRRFGNGVVRSRRRALLLHPELDEFLGRTIFFCFQQSVAPDEVWLRKIDKDSEPSFDRIAFRRQIGAVEWIAHFQAQRVARAETARFNSESFAFFERGIPKLHRVARTKENFNAVLAGVTGSRDGNLCSIERTIDDRVSGRKIDIFAEQRMKQFRDTRPLNGDSAKICAAVYDCRGIGILPIIFRSTGCRPTPLFQPHEIFVRASGVYHEQKSLLADSVCDQVVNNSAALVQE